MSVSVTELAEMHGWRHDEKLSFVSRADGTVALEDVSGNPVQVTEIVYRDLISAGYAKKPGSEIDLDFIPDKKARRKQQMCLFAVRRDEELRANGNAPCRAFEILKEELLAHHHHGPSVPKKFNPKTLSIWKNKLKKGGPGALMPRSDKQGYPYARHDELYEGFVYDVLEDLYLKSDRISISLAANKAEDLYRDKCEELRIEEPNACAMKSFKSVLATLRADDVIKARNDTETSRKLRLQAVFYARINYPLDLVEIDTTPANVHLRDRNGNCIGRPTVSVAVDAATGAALGLRFSLDAPREILTVQTLKDVMSPRDDDFFDRHGIENRIQMNGVPQILSCDQGSENSGEWLPGIIAYSGMELGKNCPGCPDKKPFVERFNRELSRFFESLPGATTSPTMPNKTRTDKAMVEACMTLEELESETYKWLYDDYFKKVRRLIHSPLRVPESPTDSWKRLVQGMARLPIGPEEIAQIFMVEEEGRKLQHYGIDLRGVQYHSPGLKELISTLGRKATVDVRYDPTDIRAIAVIHDVAEIENPLIVPAKSKEIAPISFDDVKRIKTLSPEAKKQDRKARSKAYDIASAAQKLAEDRGTGKISNVREAKKKERMRQKTAEMKERARTPPLQQTSAMASVNQPTPRMPVRRRERPPQMDILE